MEACGGLVRCAKLFCLAQKRGFCIDDVDCQFCGLPFLDEEKDMKPQVKHQCSNCNKLTKGDKYAVCNPLLPFLQSGVGNNPFCDLEIEDVVDCVITNGG